VHAVAALRRLGLLLTTALVLLTACGGDDSPGEYTDATREAFMAGCVEDDSDRDLREVCECTYERAVEELPFEEFEEAEQRLASGETDVPDAFADLILDCIREVSRSRS
jgi:hypothetical protein